MNWFKRHLNLTVIIITVLSNVIGYFLMDLFMDVFQISPWGPKYEGMNIIIDHPAGSPTIFGDGILIIATILSIIGFTWVLIQKHRYWAYLFFFIPFLVVDIPVFITGITTWEVPASLSVIMGILRLFMIILWFAGWIILLSLKNKNVPLVEGANLNNSNES